MSGFASSSGISGVNGAAAWTNLPGVTGAPNDDVTVIIPLSLIHI